MQADVRLWQGELDVLAPRSHGEYVASRLPNARFELLEGGGHFLDEEWAVVYDWLTAGENAGEPRFPTSPLLDDVGAIRSFQEPATRAVVRQFLSLRNSRRARPGSAG